MQTPSPRKPRGRPKKGERVGTFVSLPVEMRSAAEAIAVAEGLPLGDVIVRLLSGPLGIPAPSYCYPPPSAQQELPLTQAS